MVRFTDSPFKCRTPEVDSKNNILGRCPEGKLIEDSEKMFHPNIGGRVPRLDISPM